jgi:hypothetical protein
MNQRWVILDGDLSLDNVSEILLPLEPLWDTFAPLGLVHLDLSGVTFIWPAAITLLTTTVLRLRQDGFPVCITRPNSDKVDGYLNRMDFYALADVEADYAWQRHSSEGRFCEVVQARSEKEGEAVVGDLMRILDRSVEGVSTVYNAVQYALLEIVNNVFHHAHSPTQAVVCAQLYTKLRRVELAVVDSGRGIPASLSGNPELAGQFSTTPEAIELATRPRVTGRPDYNTGEGLFFTMEFVKANGGDACLHSQDGALWVRGGQVSLQMTPFWPGTWVGLRFHTDRPVDTKAIFDQHAPPEDDYEWLFDG